MEEGDSSTAIKERLQRATGVPAADIKLRLGGYNQMVMIDKASNIRVGSCGVTQGAHSVLLATLPGGCWADAPTPLRAQPCRRWTAARPCRRASSERCAFQACAKRSRSSGEDASASKGTAAAWCQYSRATSAFLRPLGVSVQRFASSERNRKAAQRFGGAMMALASAAPRGRAAKPAAHALRARRCAPLAACRSSYAGAPLAPAVMPARRRCASGQRVAPPTSAALRALLWDCDGVILESEDLHRRAYNATFAHFGVVVDGKARHRRRTSGAASVLTRRALLAHRLWSGARSTTTSSATL